MEAPGRVVAPGIVEAAPGTVQLDRFAAVLVYI